MPFSREQRRRGTDDLPEGRTRFIHFASKALPLLVERPRGHAPDTSSSTVDALTCVEMGGDCRLLGRGTAASSTVREQIWHGVRCE